MYMASQFAELLEKVLCGCHEGIYPHGDISQLVDDAVYGHDGSIAIGDGASHRPTWPLPRPHVRTCEAFRNLGLASPSA